VNKPTKPSRAKSKAPARKAPKKTVKAATKAKKATKKTAMSRRSDYGAPIQTFFDKQPPALRAIVDELRALIEAAAPNATSSLKWGMPVYELNGKMTFAIGAHKAHVNLILAGAPETFADPEGLLDGSSNLGKHLKLRSLEELPKAAVRRWLKAGVNAARSK